MPIDPRAESSGRIDPPAPLPYVSRRALRRVKHPLPIPESCRYCSAPVELVGNWQIYGQPFGQWPYAYRCTGCRAHVGLHPHTDIPLGTLADESLRRDRQHCKARFEVMRRRYFRRRGDAYAWLAGQMEIPQEQCHWGWFDEGQCRAAALAVEAYMAEREGLSA